MEKGLLRAVQVELLSPESFAETPQHIPYQAHKQIPCRQKIQLNMKKAIYMPRKNKTCPVYLTS